MKLMSLFAVTTVFAALSGCAHHQMMQGSVAMKAGDREAHVCLGDNEVKVGDKVVAFRNDCKPRANFGVSERGGRGVVCKLEKLGEGKVISLMNDHYSTVEFEPGVTFEEGTVVRKE